MILSFDLSADEDGGALPWRSIALTDGDRTMELLADARIALGKLTLGWPDVRSVTQARTDRSGTTDRTRLHGARALTVDLTIFGPGTWALLDELLAFCHPSARPLLLLDNSDWPAPRRVRLRTEQVSAPAIAEMLDGVAVQMSWVAPDGVLEAADELSATVMASGGAGSVGIRYPVRYPLTYAPGGGSGIVTVTNPGTAPASPVARLYGPHTGPELVLDGVGSLSFPGLAIAAGDYLEVDFAAHTARVNGLPDASRYGALDFATATWWALPPGSSSVRFTPDNYAGAAQALLTYRPTYL